jgi:hypothetical protein
MDVNGIFILLFIFFISEIVFPLREDARRADFTLLDKGAATGDEVMGTEAVRKQADGCDETGRYGLERTSDAEDGH